MKGRMAGALSPESDTRGENGQENGKPPTAGPLLGPVGRLAVQISGILDIIGVHKIKLYKHKNKWFLFASTL